MRALAKAAVRFVPRPLLEPLVDWRFGGGLISRPEPWRASAEGLAVSYRGIQFSVDPSWRDHLRFHFCTNIDSRHELDSFVRSAAESGGRLFDVGAFRGLFSLIYCAARPDNRAVLFEPSPAPAADARAALARNGFENSAVIRQVLVGTRTGTIAASADQTGYIDLKPTTAPTLEVEGVRLDDEMDRLGTTPTVVKIDVEGAELDVLRGAPRLLARHPAVFLELHLDALRRQGDDPAAVLRLLSDAGYQVFTHHGRRVTGATIGRSLKAVLRLIAR